jgi:ERF superfamily
MSERVYRQLQATVPNADTPAQTAALRLALQSLLLDSQFVLEATEEVYVRSRLDEAAWSDDIRHTLEVIAARWKRQRIQHYGEEEAQTPPRPTDEGHNTMSTSIPDVSLPENGRSMTDDDKNLMDAIIEELRSEGAQWTMPPTKLDRARQALLDERIEPGYPPGLWHARGTKKADGTTPSYTITDRCTCPQGSEYGKSKYCTHMTAVEIAKRMAEAKAHHGQWQLFGPPQTVEERLAAVPAPETLPDAEQGDTRDTPEDDGMLIDPEDDWFSMQQDVSEEAPSEPQEARTPQNRTPRGVPAQEPRGEALAGLQEDMPPTTHAPIAPDADEDGPENTILPEEVAQDPETIVEAPEGLPGGTAATQIPTVWFPVTPPVITVTPCYVAQDRIERSDRIDQLMTALARAQAKMQNPTHDKWNPHFKAHYTSLAGVRDAVMPCLAAEGIALTQIPSAEDKIVLITTGLWHTSGQYLCSTLRFPVTRPGDQGFGATIAYMRRYALMAICNVAGDEDDDGGPVRDKEGEHRPAVPTLTPKAPLEEIRERLTALGHTVTGQRQAAQLLESLGIAYAFTEANYGKIIAKLKELAHVSH